MPFRTSSSKKSKNVPPKGVVREALGSDTTRYTLSAETAVFRSEYRDLTFCPFQISHEMQGKEF